MASNNWKVYIHTNLSNNKNMLALHLKRPEHRWNSGRGYKENPHFYSAIEKCGWDGFRHDIVRENLTKEEAFEIERKLILLLNTFDRKYGYNMTFGGEGTPGYHPSEETRKKLSIARRRENLSEETLRRRSEGLRGRRFSESHRKKIGDSNSKRINMFSKNGEFLRSFRSARDAECELGISHSHISQCCHNNRKTAGGYIWKFAQ